MIFSTNHVVASVHCKGKLKQRTSWRAFRYCSRHQKRGNNSVVVNMAVSDEVQSVDARNVTVVERRKANTTKVAQTFYRRTGSLLRNPIVSLHADQDGEILALFFPALFALVLEPVQALIDTSIVGRLGVPELGAVGLGTVTFQFALGFFATFIFATTPMVASHAALKNNEKASIVTCRGSGVALLAGILLQCGVTFAAPGFMSTLSSDGQIAHLATEYLQARAWGLPSALVMMVSIGAARGHKDMVAPFLGSAAYGVALGLLDLLFVFGFDWGVAGAGYAASISQWIGAFTVLSVLNHRGQVLFRDLLKLPSLEDAMPYLKMAPSLALSSVAALAPMLASSSLATNLGPDDLAAHTVLRQLSSFWLQIFLAFNATAHSTIASSLSSRNKREGMELASRYMERISHLALAMSIPLGLVLFFTKSFLPGIFTENDIVGSDVVLVLPILLALMVRDNTNIYIYTCKYTYILSLIC